MIVTILRMWTWHWNGRDKFRFKNQLHRMYMTRTTRKWAHIEQARAFMFICTSVQHVTFEVMFEKLMASNVYFMECSISDHRYFCVKMLKASTLWVSTETFLTIIWRDSKLKFMFSFFLFLLLSLLLLWFTYGITTNHPHFMSHFKYFKRSTDLRSVCYLLFSL